MEEIKKSQISFRSITKTLEDFWEKNGCSVLPSYDLEMGAGTYHPFSTLGMVEKEGLSICCLQRCRRPYDSMGGVSGNRLYTFHQMQVILKPSPVNILDLFFESLEAIGINTKKNEIKFLESDWKSPTLGCYGIGWEVLCNGMEIAQFTHFQKIALQTCGQITEIAYGMERLLLKACNQSVIYNCAWDNHRSYGHLWLNQETEFARINESLIAVSDPGDCERHIKKAYKFLENDGFLNCYEEIIKACNSYNLLEKTNKLANFERCNLVQKLQKSAEDCFTKFLNYQKKEINKDEKLDINEGKKTNYN